MENVIPVQQVPGNPIRSSCTNAKTTDGKLDAALGMSFISMDYMTVNASTMSSALPGISSLSTFVILTSSLAAVLSILY